ncbi:MAG: DUF3570 domain-containing protein [Myxococcota bacterium]
MWLQLTAAGAAEPLTLTDASARVDSYADEDISTVGPGARVVAGADAWTVGASWSADFVSGATPVIRSDVVSSATTFSDVRNAPGVDVALSPTGTWSARASWSASLERDFVAHVAGVGASTDAFGRMVTLRADYRARFETTGRADDASYAERATGHALDLGWVQILGRTTSMSVLATGQWDQCSDALGCQANPYRLLLVDGVVLAERHPAERARLAAALRLSQAVGERSAAHGGYRYYTDAWGVAGHTADLALVRALLADRLQLRATGRWSTQSAASFWRATYAGAPAWRTADRELEALSSWGAGAAADWSFYAAGPFARFGVGARLDRLWYRYPDDPYVSSRAAWLFGGGLDADF